MARHIEVVGQDPSLRHWGIAKGLYDTVDKSLKIHSLSVLEPVLPTGKQVRQNSLDLETAVQLTVGAVDAARDSNATFVEVPVGSQSARAMASYGVCVGVLGAMRGGGIAFFEVTPTEVKVAAVGYANAKKREMISWAMKAHPEANWPMYKKNGVMLVSEAQAEHMADAIGAIYAGIKGNSFQQMLALRQ